MERDVWLNFVKSLKIIAWLTQRHQGITTGRPDLQVTTESLRNRRASRMSCPTCFECTASYRSLEPSMLIDPQGNIAFLEEHDTQGPDRRPHKIIRSPTNATTKYMNEYDRPHAVKLPSIAVLLCLSPRAAYRIATGWRSSGIAFKLTHQTSGPGDLVAFQPFVAATLTFATVCNANTLAQAPEPRSACIM